MTTPEDPTFSFAVVGMFPDGTKKVWKVCETEDQAKMLILKTTRHCTPCAKLTYGELSIEKIPKQ